MKRLGFGLMRLPLLDQADPSSIDMERMRDMVDAFIAKGFTYFDTAWMYQAFASEKAARVALVERHSRDSFTLATKLHSSFFDSLEDRDKIFNAQLDNTGAGYFDYYLLHGIEAGSIGKYEELDCFNWLLDKRAKGLVKHVGFSFHDTPELLDRILTRHPEVEFVQLQINYLDWDSPWVHAGACYETARRHGKDIIVMEPVKGGTLARLPKEAEELLRALAPEMSPASWAVRFAASLPGVMMVLSGMSTLAQVEDNLSYMSDFQPLTQEEKAACFRAAEIINSRITIPCTGCSYCTEGCPKKIAIPQYFSLYNEDMRETNPRKDWTVNFTNYDQLTKRFGKAKACISCGQCVGVCPQHLAIPQLLTKVSARYDH